MKVPELKTFEVFVFLSLKNEVFHFFVVPAEVEEFEISETSCSLPCRDKSTNENGTKTITKRRWYQRFGKSNV